MEKVFTLLLIVILSSCSSEPHIVKTDEEYSGKGNKKIYVVSHGWHTGFVVPSEHIYKEVPELKDRFGDIRSIEFGWGDKGFYQSKEITSGLTLRAIFWPTESVVHAVSVPQGVY